MPKKKTLDSGKLDRIVAQSQTNKLQRELGYREQALKLYPWICGRCSRVFTRENLKELTVHHRDHDHDNNISDGSNWELLCVYCHDNEHSRYIDAAAQGPVTAGGNKNVGAGHNPFANLKSLLEGKE